MRISKTPKFNRYSVIEKEYKTVSYTVSCKHEIRLDNLVTLDYFNINRKDIIKAIKYNYHILSIDNIIYIIQKMLNIDKGNYTRHPEIYTDINNEYLNKLIKKEVQRVINSITELNYTIDFK